jgi:WD40 repeat protein/tRNA A-37 threonylcarbamoyl transferase component Bud32
MANPSDDQRTVAHTARAPEPATAAAATVPSLSGVAGLGRPEQVSRVCTHQEERWQCGDRALLEEYLEQLPGLRDDADALLYLVMHEISLRDERGETPLQAEYQKRFPALAEALQREFVLRRAAGIGTRGGDDAATVPPPGQTTGDGESTAGLPRSSVPGYEILGELGRGGMGVVYKARQAGLNRVVALKMVLAAEHAGVEGLARFRIEAEAVAQLQHPHIVQIYEIGEQDGRPFFSLEFVNGGSLEDRMDTGPQPPRWSAEMVEKLARAMQFAHERNIVHRDLKPANILLMPDGTPKITDFGLAKRMDTQGQTQAGDIMGTPSYMAPEQAGSGPEIGPAADVYALGALLYDMLVGRPPFQAATSMDTILQVLGEEPVPPRRLQSKVPRDLETICLRCLEKQPHKRYASAAALADDLQRFLQGEPIQARPAGLGERLLKWVRRRPTLAALVAACIMIAVTLVGGGIWSYSALAAAAKRETARATEAEQATKRAEQALMESRHRLIRNEVETGLGLADSGYLVYSLPWLTHAWLLEREDAGREMNGRIRLGTVLRGCPPLAQVWLHQGPVTDLAFSPDGGRIVTSSQRSARIWDAKTGAELGKPLVHDDVVNRVAFSPNGQYVLTASDDKTARLWATDSGTSRVLNHQGPVVQACFSKDSSRAVTGSEDQTAQVWDVASGKRVGLPLKHDAPVTAVSFSPDGLRVLTGSGNVAQFWDAATGKALGAPLRHEGEVSAVAYSPDGLRVATASSDGARLWDAASGRQLHSLLDKPAAVRLVAFGPDGGRLVTLSRNEARVWDTNTGKPLPFTIAHDSTILDAVFSADGRRLATCGDDNFAMVSDAATGSLLVPRLTHVADPTRIAFSPDGRMVATACEDGLVRLRALDVSPAGLVLPHPAEVKHVFYTSDGKRLLTADKEHGIHVWDAERNVELSRWKSERPLGFVEFTADGRWVAAAQDNGAVRVWETASGAAVSPAMRHDKKIKQLAFSLDGTRLITASADHTARIWDCRSGECLTPPLQHADSVNRVAFSPDGRQVVTASADKTARVWDAASGKPLLPPLTHQDEVYWAAWSADGRRIATASEDRTARVWDARTGQPLTEPLPHPSRCYEVRFSADGRWVITACDDNAARIWDAASGRLAVPALYHLGRINDAVISPHNRWALTVAEDGVARVWEAASGLPLLPKFRHDGPILDAAFSPDGQRVATAGGDRSVRVWQLLPDMRPLEDLRSLSRVMCEADIDATGGIQPLPAPELLRLWGELRRKYPKDFAPR